MELVVTNGIRILESIKEEIDCASEYDVLSYPKDWHESWPDSWRDSHRP